MHGSPLNGTGSGTKSNRDYAVSFFQYDFISSCVVLCIF